MQRLDARALNRALLACCESRKQGQRPVGLDDGEVSSVDRGDLVDAKPFRTGDHRRIDRSERKVAVPVDEVGYPEPVDRMHGFDVKYAGGHIAKETQFSLSAESRAEQVDDLSDHQRRNDQRARMGLQEVCTCLMMPVVGIDIGIKRTGIDNESYDATSLRRISSIRSEMSCCPLRPAARAPRTRRPPVSARRSSTSASSAGTMAASRRPRSVRYTTSPDAAASRAIADSSSSSGSGISVTSA